MKIKFTNILSFYFVQQLYKLKKIYILFFINNLIN